MVNEKLGNRFGNNKLENKSKPDEWLRERARPQKIFGGWGVNAKTALGLLTILILSTILLALLLLPSFLAIPNDLTINGRLTNSAGSSLAGSYTVNFSIYYNNLQIRDRVKFIYKKV